MRFVVRLVAPQSVPFVVSLDVANELSEFDTDVELAVKFDEADSEENAELELEQSLELGSNQCDPMGPPASVKRTANISSRLMWAAVGLTIALLPRNYYVCVRSTCG